VPTVSGTVTDSSGNTAPWSVDFTVAGSPPISFGVCSHQLTFRSPGSIWTQDAQVAAAVADLKVTGIRDMLPPGTDTTGIIRSYNAVGVKHHLSVGTYPTVDSYDWVKAMNRLRSVVGCVTEVAGVNEPDGDGRARSVWLPQVVKHQTALWNKVTSDSTLAGTLKVGLGALRWQNNAWKADNAAMVAACAGKFEFFNMHFYPGGGSNVEAELADAIADIRTFWQGPIVISEGGGSSANMGETEQARICADLVKACNKFGVKLYIYELVDDPNPAGDDPESNFAPYESDWSRKPAADALRALVP
jgi:hypothetical protein